jgi:Na+/proline symporter
LAASLCFPVLSLTSSFAFFALAVLGFAACLPLLVMAHIKQTAHVSNDDAYPEGANATTHKVVEVLLALNKDSLEVAAS